jgi:hypothetical protein
MRSTAGSGTAENRTGGVSRPSSLGDIAGRPKPSAGGTGSNRAIGKGGWAGYKKDSAERSQKYPTLDIGKDPVAIRFAEHDPMAYIFRHWIDRKPFTCIGEDCPLCEAGHRAKPVVFYNVITVDDNVLRVWELSKEPTGKVHKQYERLEGQGKTLDDQSVYFVISKTKKDNNFFEYDVERVPARDLQDETGLEPLTEDEIAAAVDNKGKGLFTDEIIYLHSKSDLRDAVDNITDTD